jgi:hypothetical protein
MPRARADAECPKEIHTMPRIPQTPIGSASRLLFGVFGLVFLGIGLTVLGFLWGSPFDEFDSPPLFFRIFGSFIAVAFVAMGGTIAYSAIRGGGMLGGTMPGGLMSSGLMSEANAMIAAAQQRAQAVAENATPRESSLGYACPSCGAALGEKVDVSPMGDVKCAFCGRWFNVHKST